MLKKINNQAIFVLFFVSGFSLQASQNQGTRDPLLSYLLPSYTSFNSSSTLSKSSYNQCNEQQEYAVDVQILQQKIEAQKAIQEELDKIEKMRNAFRDRISTASLVAQQVELGEENRMLEALLGKYSLQQKTLWWNPLCKGSSSSKFKYKKPACEHVSRDAKNIDYLAQKNIYLAKRVEALRLQYQINENA